MKTQHTNAEYTLTPKEVQTIIDSVTNFRDRCMIKCMYYGGMRVSEVVHLRAEHIDFERERINIFESKGGKTRTIPVIDRSMLSDISILLGKRNQGNIFLNKDGKGMTTRNAKLIVAKWGHKSGVKHPNPYKKNINCHIFRHAIARHLKSAGYIAEFVQKFLGHASIKTTMDIYGKLSIDEMQQILHQKQGRIPQEEVRRLE